MVKLGVIGYGGRCKDVVSILKQACPELIVTGIVDPNQEKVKERLSEEELGKAKFYETMDEMVKGAKPDALLIGTRCNLHTPMAIEAEKFGLPIYLEKPVSISMEQARALDKAYENSKTPVMVSFPLRVSPLCEITKEFIDKGSIGKPVHIAATNYVSYGTVYWEHEYRNYEITGGLFLQKATHDIDYMSYLMGEPIVRVAAMGTWHHVFGGDKPSGLTCAECDECDSCLESPVLRGRNNPNGNYKDHKCLFSVDCGDKEKGTNEDCSSVLVEFASGAHGVYTQVFYAKRDASKRGAIISGYEGTLDFDWYTNKLKYIRHHRPFSDVINPADGMSHFGGDIELAHDFIDLVKGKRTSVRAGLKDGINSVYACLAARESALTGKFVDVVG